MQNKKGIFIIALLTNSSFLSAMTIPGQAFNRPKKTTRLNAQSQNNKIIKRYESNSEHTNDSNPDDMLQKNLNPECALLQKFTKEYAPSIYAALQQCLKEESAKTALGCKSGLGLFKAARKIIKERNIPMTSEEETLFNIMEEKYSNGPSSVCYNPCASKIESGVA